MDLQLKGMTAIVTGGTAGIGLAIVPALSQMEWGAEPSSRAGSPLPKIDPKYPEHRRHQVVRVRIQGGPAPVA
jgi:NAD(P)-dependent dehydrogenase (short-subunit alcohol dehydrogenase family)